MNSILQLKGQFDHKKNTNQFGSTNLPVGKSVTSLHIDDLRNELISILNFWRNDTLIDGALVSVHYKHVVAKSNRIKALLVKNSTMKANDSIRGAKFEGSQPNIKHVFTHYVPLDAIQESIRRLSVCANIVNESYNGTISYSDIVKLNESKKKFNAISLSIFLSVIVDAYHVDKFSIDQNTEEVAEQTIITIYKTKYSTSELLGKIGINILDATVIDETTIRLNPIQLKILIDKAPYLIAMQTIDLAKITKDDISSCTKNANSISSPKNEPFIGVIDTLFSSNVYFREWVSYEKYIDENIDTDDDDFFHGTAISSIIVDGPALNPELEDGCGRFRVKHFGVATKDHFSSFSILKAIRKIVSLNNDIKVWNLSLGSELEINKNFISPEAAELDRIQNDYDVIFVVSGTNKPKRHNSVMRIGAPADSLNSLVVNAVDNSNKPASYHRVGPVLSFFHKPDVSYYGGDGREKIKVCTKKGESFVSGTSFAAPWVTRKVAFLIYNMGFSREVAKALIIDATAGWNRQDNISHAIGYGIVPKRIESILQSPDDEIRFIMTGAADSYETYTYNIPVPTYMDKHPFFARATLCYFPKCSRSQGVDYTDTEMDIHFGRISETKKGTQIKSINNNIQGNDGLNALYEDSARQLYRKWDNIKHIGDIIKNNSKPRKKYGIGNWGLSIKTKYRLNSLADKGMKFGVVITLKEMNGENRIDDFIKLCMVRGWIVNKIDIENRIDVYNKAEENVIFE